MFSSHITLAVCVGVSCLKNILLSRRLRILVMSLSLSPSLARSPAAMSQCLSLATLLSPAPSLGVYCKSLSALGGGSDFLIITLKYHNLLYIFPFFLIIFTHSRVSFFFFHFHDSSSFFSLNFTLNGRTEKTKQAGAGAPRAGHDRPPHRVVLLFQTRGRGRHSGLLFLRFFFIKHCSIYIIFYA